MKLTGVKDEGSIIHVKGEGTIVTGETRYVTDNRTGKRDEYLVSKVTYVDTNTFEAVYLKVHKNRARREIPTLDDDFLNLGRINPVVYIIGAAVVGLALLVLALSYWPY